MILAIIMVLGAGIFRLAANEFHWWNVAPLAAIALIGGMYLGRRIALWVPLVVLAVTDVIINVQMGYPVFYWARLFDYGAFLLIGLLGLWARSRKPSVKVAAAIATPFLFFFISNFAVWLFGLDLNNGAYAKTFTGLVNCYTAAIPFFRGTLIGDWAFMAVFALIAVLMGRTSSEPQPALTSQAGA